MKYSFVCIPISLFFIFLSACSYSKNLQIIRSANEAHYNLTTAGLKSFSCKIGVKELNEMSQRLQDINFFNSDKGYLLKDYKVRLIDEPIEISAEIDYRQIEGFYLPQTVTILNNLKTGPVGITLSFFEYTLDKF